MTSDGSSDGGGDGGHGSAVVNALLIAGPTGSGKSALALSLASALGGEIINADSMQVYRDLRIITARPTRDEEGAVPHRLYGHVDAAQTYSAGQWLAEIAPVLADVRAAGRRPIIVGGTGLYFKLLTGGLAAIPPIPTLVREAVRRRLAAEGAPALHAALRAVDPDAAARLQPTDRSRVARALEVFEATGRSILSWHREGMPALIDPAQAVALFLAPPRPALYRRIDERFAAMLAAGALDEVRVLHARGLDPLLPAMKAHGVPWLIRHLRGEITLEAAAEEARRDTRHYAKRQMTWFRNQLPFFDRIAPEVAADAVRARLGWSDFAFP